MIVEVEDWIELLKLFLLFYYFNGGLPLTNCLLLIPDGETPDGSKKYPPRRTYMKCLRTHNLTG